MLREKVREIRIKQGITQAVMAKALNISQQTLCQYEKGERAITLELFEAMLHFLQIDFQLHEMKPENPVAGLTKKQKLSYEEGVAYAIDLLQKEKDQTVKIEELAKRGEHFLKGLRSKLTSQILGESVFILSEAINGWDQDLYQLKIEDAKEFFNVQSIKELEEGLKDSDPSEVSIFIRELSYRKILKTIHIIEENAQEASRYSVGEILDKIREYLLEKTGKTLEIDGYYDVERGTMGVWLKNEQDEEYLPREVSGTCYSDELADLFLGELFGDCQYYVRYENSKDFVYIIKNN